MKKRSKELLDFLEIWDWGLGEGDLGRMLGCWEGFRDFWELLKIGFGCMLKFRIINGIILFVLTIYEIKVLGIFF